MGSLQQLHVKVKQRNKANSYHGKLNYSLVTFLVIIKHLKMNSSTISTNFKTIKFHHQDFTEKNQEPTVTRWSSATVPYYFCRRYGDGTTRDCDKPVLTAAHSVTIP